MDNVNLADAKARLSALVAGAEAGEPVRILRRGKAVAQITAVTTARKPIDLAALRAVTRGMPMATTDSGTLVRTMRDAERY